MQGDSHVALCCAAAKGFAGVVRYSNVEIGFQMACGVPIVGFDVPGVRDLVVPACAGELAKDGDIDALTDIMENMMGLASLPDF